VAPGRSRRRDPQIALRLACFGSPGFAVPTLRRLLAGRHPVVGVVTQPDRPRGRGRRPGPCPMAVAAREAGLPLLQPERVGDPGSLEQLRALSADLGVVVAYGQFLPRPVREAPRLGFLVNAHASLLPRWRGAAPVARAILAGDRETGVSLMRVEREMDAGPVARAVRTPIGPDEDAGALEARLAELAAALVAEGVEAIAAGSARFEPQDPAGVTFAPKLEAAELELDWREPAEALARRVRALAPRPGARTRLAGEPLRVLAARIGAAPAGTEPGTVQGTGSGRFRVATGSGWLELLRVQRAGGRALGAPEFLRGRPVAEGTRLG
jgi:methionyl-tRNA formyltransferase